MYFYLFIFIHLFLYYLFSVFDLAFDENNNSGTPYVRNIFGVLGRIFMGYRTCSIHTAGAKSYRLTHDS